MRSSRSLDRLDTAFDDDRLVADAGLLLPVTLARHFGLRDLVDEHVHLGDKPGAANPGDKLATLVKSAPRRGDCIDDGTHRGPAAPSGVLGFSVKAASTKVIAHNLARWTARIGLGEGIVTTKTLRRRLFGLVERLTRSARRGTLHLPARWPWADEFLAALARFRAIPLLA